MTMTASARLQPARQIRKSDLRRSYWRRFVDGILLLIDAFDEARRLRQSIRELQMLDDRTLADIGLVRSGIESAVRGPDPDLVPRSPQPTTTKPTLALAA